MALSIIKKCSIRSLEEKFLGLSVVVGTQQSRPSTNYIPRPRLRNPTWFTRKTLEKPNDFITSENKEFIQEIIQDKYPKIDENTVKADEISNAEWTPKIQRTGIIARKIGIYPLWLKNGKKISTTLLQVLDNHVIKYQSPEEYDPPRRRPIPIINKKGCLLIGADAADPQTLTREYCGIFKESGVIPKRIIRRFYISPDAALPLGTLLTAMHFQVGNVVDVRGKTIDHGFQGVIKRHGFKGMPASHGVTKTHRRGGNIGGGGEKARVWPGTKMPGHMGNTLRVAKGVKILRINTKYNVIWVTGQAIPGETNSIVTILDTILPLRRPTNRVPFPTFLGKPDESQPIDMFDESVHQFSEPSIFYNEPK